MILPADVRLARKQGKGHDAVKATPGLTAKHAGSHKHVGSRKHKPAHRSAAQIAASKKWGAKGAAARHAAAVAKHAGHPAPAKWTPNADVACCVAEALAVSLRLTGREVSGRDVLDLYWRTADDPEAGSTIEATIEAAAVHGLAGVRLVDARPVRWALDGVVLGVDLAERHAVTVDGPGVWSWGGWRPVSGRFLAGADEAWQILWGVNDADRGV